MPEDDPATKAALELFKNDLQHHETLSGALSALIQSTLRVAFLLNGAAIVAALTAYGAKVAKAAGQTEALAFPERALGIALLIWVFGLTMSAIASATYTTAQRRFQIAAWDQVRERAKDHFSIVLNGEKGDAAVFGSCYRKLATIAWWLSLVAFVVGASTAVVGAFLI
jgi:hypothetical protein